MSSHLGDRLSAFLDGELSPQERAEVRVHLERCAECARRRDEWASVDAAVKGDSWTVPTGYFDSFANRVAARLEPRRKVAGRAPWWIGAMAAGLAAAVVTLQGRVAERAPDPAVSPTAAPGEAAVFPRTEAPAPAIRQPAAAEPPAPQPGGGSPRQEAETQPRNRAAAAPAAASGKTEGFAAAPADAVPAPAAPPAPRPAKPAAATPAPGDAEAAVFEGHSAVLESTETAPEEQRLARSGDASGGSGEAKTARAKAAGARAGSARIAEARRERDRWMAAYRRDPNNPAADGRRIKALEAADAAFRLSGDADDARFLLEEGTAYLEEGGREGERVRAWLRATRARRGEEAPATESR